MHPGKVPWGSRESTSRSKAGAADGLDPVSPPEPSKHGPMPVAAFTSHKSLAPTVPMSPQQLHCARRTEQCFSKAR